MNNTDYSGAFDALLKSKKELDQQNSAQKMKPFKKFKMSKEEEI